MICHIFRHKQTIRCFLKVLLTVLQYFLRPCSPFWITSSYPYFGYWIIDNQGNLKVNISNSSFNTVPVNFECKGFSPANNYANPVYGVATIFHQVCCLCWGHLSLFHTAMSLLIWYTMFCMRDISYRLIWMKFINMLSVYAQSWMHRRFNWWIFAVWT